MKIKVLAHGNTNPDKVLMLYKTARFYAKYLNIIKFDVTVYICSAPNLRKTQNNNGVCSKTDYREITVAVDSTLVLPQLLITLAHEMVHVKQYVRGQYRGELSRNGKMKRIWLGKQYNVAYMKRPWEVEAFRREMELTTALVTSVAKKHQKEKLCT